MLRKFKEITIYPNLNKLAQISKKLLLTASLMLLLNPFSTFAMTTAEELQSIQDQKTQVDTQINSLQGEIDGLQGEINDLQTKINDSQAKIDNLNSQIELIKTKILKLKELLGSYLRSMYIDGQSSDLELVLTSNSFSEFVDKAEYKQSMTSKIRGTLSEINTNKQELEESIKDVEVEKSNLLGLMADAESKQNSVIGQQNQQYNIYENLSQKEKEVLERMRREQDEARGRIVCSDANRIDSDGFQQPVRCGAISQGYGMTDFAATGIYGYENGSPKIHNGIDIAADTGTAVYSSARGTVVYAGANGGWGNTIVILHENGYFSRYGHLSGIFVSVGETVNATTQIGAVGSTGFSTGPHLHFSIYLPGVNYEYYNNSNTVNPFSFFSM